MINHQPNKQKIKFTTKKILLGYALLVISGTNVFAETLSTPEVMKTQQAITVHINTMLGDDKKIQSTDQPLWKKDQSEQAALEKKLKESIKADPDNKQNYAYLGALYLSNNKSAKAVKAYQNAIIHDPINPKLFTAISIAYLHQSKFSMAKAMADQALKIDPSLKSVDKIKEYISAKQKVMNAASKMAIEINNSKVVK